MEGIDKLFNDLPLIVQGAFGSALFWAAIELMQWLTNLFSKTTSSYTKKLRKSFLRTEYYQCLVDDSDDNDDFSQMHFGLTVLIYRAMRNFGKAFIWIVLGIICNIFISPFGIVIGCLGATYYLLKAVGVLASRKNKQEPAERMKEIENEFEEMENITSN